MLGPACSRFTAASGGGIGELTVRADEGIDLSKVRVEWVSPASERVVVWESGLRTPAEIPASERDAFEVYLGTQVVGGAGIDRSGADHRNDFHFTLRKDREGLLVSLVVEGPDSANGFYTKRYHRDLTGSITRVSYYDLAGLMTHETYSKYSAQGELETNNRFDYRYDEQGRKVWMQHRVTTPDGNQKGRIENTYAYDSLGRETEQSIRSFDAGDRLQFHNVNRFVLDELGRKKEMEFLSRNADGEVASHRITRYEYDERGLLVGEELLDADRKLQSRMEKVYDADRDLVEERYILYGPDGRETGRSGQVYDKRGRLIRQY